MAQMVQFDLYAVAATTSEIKLFQISTGVGGKGHIQGTTSLAKSCTLVEHRKEIIAVNFDADLSASIAFDHKLVLYRLSGDAKQARQTKLLFSHHFGEEVVQEISQVAIKKVSVAPGAASGDKEQVYVAISDATGFTVWHLTLDKRGESVESGPTQVSRVDMAHNGEHIISMSFTTIGEDSYLVTSSGLDQRVNFWRY